MIPGYICGWIICFWTDHLTTYSYQWPVYTSENVDFFTSINSRLIKWECFWVKFISTRLHFPYTLVSFCFISCRSSTRISSMTVLKPKICPLYFILLNFYLFCLSHSFTCNCLKGNIQKSRMNETSQKYKNFSDTLYENTSKTITLLKLWLLCKNPVRFITVFGSWLWDCATATKWHSGSVLDPWLQYQRSPG